MPHRESLLRPRHLLGGLRVGGFVVVAFAAFFAHVAAAQVDAPADGAGKPVFLVADVVVGDGVPIDKDAARDVLATRFGRLKDKLEVRSMAEAKASIDAVAMAQMMGSGDDADLARIEGYMQVDRLVLGSVKQVGGVIDLQVKVFNVKEGITEVAFARRMGKGADRSLVLALLDTLADSLLAWTIEHYTDGSMSNEANALAGKKLGGKKPAQAAVASTSPWGLMGVAGGVGLGAGVGVASMGLYNALGTDAGFDGLSIGLVAGGAAAALIGGTAIAIDVANGAE